VYVDKLIVVRPPLLLVHGLEGFPQDWGSAWRDSRFSIEVADWHKYHADSLESNRNRVRPSVQNALRTLRHSAGEFAATQVDAVGHSAGGIITRIYMLDSMDTGTGTLPTDYLRDDNFRKGDFHKLITIDTPHYGSQVSDLVINGDNTLTWCGQVAACFTDGPTTNDPDTDKRCTKCGLVRDLRTDSPVLRRLNSAAPPIPVPVHAVYGTGGRDDITLNTWDYLKYHGRTYYGTKACGMAISDLFHGENDLVVSAFSQRGGLSPGTTATPISGDVSWHIFTIQDPTTPTAAIVFDLLNAKAADARFAPRFLNGSALPAPLCTPDPRYERSFSGLLITAPLPGSVFAPGQPFNFVVSSGINTLDLVYVTLPSGAVIMDDTVPYVIALTAPTDVVGPVTYSMNAVIGGASVCPAEVTVFVSAPSAPLRRLQTDAPSNAEVALYSCAPTFQLYLSGEYEDGILRRLGLPNPALVLSTDDPSVATVDGTGTVKARSVGRTTLRASVGGITMSVAVVVESVRGDADSNGSVGLSDLPAIVGCLSGPAPTHPASLSCRDTFDWDNDAMIDLRDFAELQNGFTGPPPP